MCTEAERLVILFHPLTLPFLSSFRIPFGRQRRSSSQAALSPILGFVCQFSYVLWMYRRLRTSTSWPSPAIPNDFSLV